MVPAMKWIRLAILPFLLSLVPSPAWGYTPLLNVLVEHGATVTLLSPRCKQGGLMGSYRPRYQILSLCVAVHRGDHLALSDTIRHEAIHHIQNCRVPVTNRDTILTRTTLSRMAEPIDFRKGDGDPAEIEAYFLARTLTDKDVIDLVRLACPRARGAFL
jgi:hypothetical protein